MPCSERPRDAGLRHMRLPVGAYASILHRITGLLLIVLTGLGLGLLKSSLQSASGFDAVRALLVQPSARFFGALVVWVVAQHLYGGLRHLTLDAHRGFGREAGRRSATLVLVLAVGTALCAALLWP